MKNRLGDYSPSVRSEMVADKDSIVQQTKHESTLDVIQQKLTQTVAGHPLAAVAFGLGAGVILGCLAKRR